MIERRARSAAYQDFYFLQYHDPLPQLAPGKMSDADAVPTRYQIVATKYSLELWQDHVHALQREIELAKDLDEQLQQEFWYLLLTECTANQLLIAKLTYEGKTQWEIADQLKINQSGVHKALMGNTCYIAGEGKKYGGLNRKLAKLIRKSRKIQGLMRDVEKLGGNITTQPFFCCFRYHAFNSYKHYTTWLEEII